VARHHRARETRLRVADDGRGDGLNIAMTCSCRRSRRHVPGQPDVIGGDTRMRLRQRSGPRINNVQGSHGMIEIALAVPLGGESARGHDDHGRGARRDPLGSADRHHPPRIHPSGGRGGYRLASDAGRVRDTCRQRHIRSQSDRGILIETSIAGGKEYGAERSAQDRNDQLT